MYYFIDGQHVLVLNDNQMKVVKSLIGVTRYHVGDTIADLWDALPENIPSVSLSIDGKCIDNCAVDYDLEN